MIFGIIVGILIGIIVGFLIKTVLERRTKYGGSIIVTKSDEKTLYTLELDDDPEQIELKKKIVFKVIVPERELLKESLKPNRE